MNALILVFTLSVFSSCQSDTVQIAGIEFEKQSLELKQGESGLTIADLDLDGHLDLISANQSIGNLSLFLGDGKGGFKHSSDVEAGSNPGFVSVADFNQDGFPDVVVANHETNYLTLLLGDSKGGFSAAKNSPLIIEVEPHPHVVKTHDLDGDGHIDIVVDHRQGEGLLVLRGLGDGEFDSPGTLVSTGGDPYRGFVIGDLNRDSKPDFVSPNPMSIGVIFSSANSSLPSTSITIPSLSPFSVEIGDFNGDGLLDIVAASEGARPAVQVYFQGEGSFSKSNQTSFDLANGAKQMAVGDLNNDGIDDIIASSWNAEVLVLIGQRNGLMRSENIRDQGRPWGIAIGDLNEDGKDDFVLADGAGERATVYLSI